MKRIALAIALMLGSSPVGVAAQSAALITIDPSVMREIDCSTARTAARDLASRSQISSSEARLAAETFLACERQTRLYEESANLARILAAGSFVLAALNEPGQPASADLKSAAAALHRIKGGSVAARSRRVYYTDRVGGAVTDTGMSPVYRAGGPFIFEPQNLARSKFDEQRMKLLERISSMQDALAAKGD